MAPLISIQESDNIFIGVAWANPILPGNDFLRLKRSSSIEMNLVAWGDGKAPDKVVNEVASWSDVVSRKSMLGAFRRGKLNWDIWSTGL